MSSTPLTETWMREHLFPHEGRLRSWLARWAGRRQEIDDVVQEAYCRVAAMRDVTHIANGRAYFYQTARNIVLEQVRRARIVRIEHVADIGALPAAHDAPSLDRELSGLHELQRVSEALERLSPKCRRAFVLKRIEGASQREIAHALGMSERAVEKQIGRALKQLTGLMNERAAEMRASSPAM